MSATDSQNMNQTTKKKPALYYDDRCSYIEYTFSDETNTWTTEPQIVNSTNVTMHVASNSIHYGQSCFEGLKAFKQPEGKIKAFRPDLSYERIAKSADTVSMPVPSKETFLDAIRIGISINSAYFPKEEGGCFYIRPIIFATGPEIDLSVSSEYKFIVCVLPMMGQFMGSMPVKAFIKADFDRSAPNGVGFAKLAGNYAPVMKPTREAKSKGYNLLLFLHGEYVDEFATSNFVGLKKDGKGGWIYITPLSSSILKSITNKSLREIAQALGYKVEERPIEWSEVASEFSFVGACGTAVVLSLVEEIYRESNGQTLKFNCKGQENGFDRLKSAYRDIQNGVYNGPKASEFSKWLWPEEGI